jgi:hypothetical protein
MNRQTLNLINSGPSGGKTTLIAQVVKASLDGIPFFIPGLDLPPGRIAWVQTDRPKQLYKPIFDFIGISDPDLEQINFLNEPYLHHMTSSRKGDDEELQIERLREAITKRIVGRNFGTLIIDLYDEFQTSQTGNGKKMGYDSRANLLWAMELDLVIIGINYCFKQKQQNGAMRAQDRSSGHLKGQASANTKISIIDSEEHSQRLERSLPYGVIEMKPGPGEGGPMKFFVIRGTKEADNDPIGLFRLYDGILAKEDAQEQEAQLKRNEPLDLKPWERLGISRATWFRRKARGEFETDIPDET